MPSNPLQLPIPPPKHRVESGRRLGGGLAAERQGVSQTTQPCVRPILQSHFLSAHQRLFEELCVAVRSVGVSTRFLPCRPPDPDLVDEIRRVHDVDAELKKRGIDPASRLVILTHETKWMMPELYQEGLGWPAMRPWVRNVVDGLRIAMVCPACRGAEFPVDSRTIRLCDGCLDSLDGAIAAATGRDHLLLYRTYTREARCEHADDETVLGVYPWSPEWSEDFPVGICRACIQAERARRKAG